MSKKRLIIFCMILICTLSGCSGLSSRTKTDQKYIISSLGFDNQENRLKMSVEAIIINSENTDAEQTLKVITGVGSTPEACLDNLSKGLAKPILLSHCGIIALGENLTPEQIKSVYDYCFRKQDITLSAYVVATENAFDLLSCEPVSSITVGYDIMGLIEQQSTRTGVSFKNRYYEVAASRERKQNIFTLPIFKTEDDSFLIDGMKIYRNDSEILLLNNRQTALYSLITNTFSKGKFLIDDEEFNVKQTDSKYKFLGGNQPEITITVNLTLGDNDLNSVDKLKSRIDEFTKTVKTQFYTDVFGFGNIIHHQDRKLWGKISSDYQKFYTDSKLTINCIVHGKSGK